MARWSFKLRLFAAHSWDTDTVRHLWGCVEPKWTDRPTDRPKIVSVPAFGFLELGSRGAEDLHPVSDAGLAHLEFSLSKTRQDASRGSRIARVAAPHLPFQTRLGECIYVSVSTLWECVRVDRSTLRKKCISFDLLHRLDGLDLRALLALLPEPAVLPLLLLERSFVDCESWSLDSPSLVGSHHWRSAIVVYSFRAPIHSQRTSSILRFFFCYVFVVFCCFSLLGNRKLKLRLRPSLSSVRETVSKLLVV